MLISCASSHDRELDKIENDIVQKNFLTSNDTLSLITSLTNLIEAGNSYELWENFNYSEVDGFVLSADFIEFFAENEIISFQDVENITNSSLFYGKALYRPFYDEELVSSITSFVFFNNTSDTHYQYFIDSFGSIQTEIITEEILPENDFVFLLDQSYSSSRALPWRRCYCSRGRYDPNTGIIYSQGDCSQGRNDEHCGQCARAGFNGDCPGGACPGC